MNISSSFVSFSLTFVFHSSLNLPFFSSSFRSLLNKLIILSRSKVIPRNIEKIDNSFRTNAESFDVESDRKELEKQIGNLLISFH